MTSFLIANAQVPDFISVKKRNGVSVKSYYSGIDISFITRDGRRYDALISRIANDSIYLKYYQIASYVNIMGTISYDTVTSYILPFHYKDIKQILLPNISYRNRWLGILGKYAQYGGFGYDVLNVVNGIYAKEKPLFDDRNIRNVSIATAIGLSGIYLKKKHGMDKQSRKRFRIVYVNMQ